MSDDSAPAGQASLVRLVADLLAQLEGTAVTECELRAGRHRVFLRRAATAAVAPPPPAEAEETVPAEWRPITAPLTGVFYVAAKPQAPPLVQVGTVIGPGQVVGLIESMKMFNEVESDTAGTVRAILVANAAVVESGQILMYVEPLRDPE